MHMDYYPLIKVCVALMECVKEKNSFWMLVMYIYSLFFQNAMIKELTTPDYKSMGLLMMKILNMDPLNLWKNLFNITQKAFPKIYII